MKVLIADDVLFIRKLFVDKLTKLGHEVIEASNGEEAVSKVKRENPDVVFMDIVMPKMDGISATKQIRETYEGKIIICSVNANKSKVLEAYEAGANDYIIKPMNDTRLIEIIEKTVNNIGKI